MCPLINWIAIVVFFPNVSFHEIEIIVFIQVSSHSSGIALFLSMALVNSYFILSFALVVGILYRGIVVSMKSKV